MSSPFSTIDAFNDAINGPTNGAIYTFAHRPSINNLFLLIAVGILIWFICKTFSTHAVSPARFDKSLNRLSSLIVVSLLSLVSVGDFHKVPFSTDVATVKPRMSDDHPSLSSRRHQRAVYRRPARSLRKRFPVGNRPDA